MLRREVDVLSRTQENGPDDGRPELCLTSADFPKARGVISGVKLGCQCRAARTTRVRECGAYERGSATRAYSIEYRRTG
jgi:hypothetical protein